MRQTGVRKVERRVDLTLSHSRQHRVDLYGLPRCGLPQDCASRHSVAFLFDMLEIQCLRTLVAEAFLEGGKNYVVAVRLRNLRQGA